MATAVMNKSKVKVVKKNEQIDSSMHKNRETLLKSQEYMQKENLSNSDAVARVSAVITKTKTTSNIDSNIPPYALRFAESNASKGRYSSNPKKPNLTLFNSKGRDIL